jgi:hypothetical protein
MSSPLRAHRSGWTLDLNRAGDDVHEVDHQVAPQEKDHGHIRPARKGVWPFGFSSFPGLSRCPKAVWVDVKSTTKHPLGEGKPQPLYQREEGH